MPEIQTLVDIGKLEVQVEAIKNDVGALKKEIKTLSENVVTALTEMKVSQAKFQSTTEKVHDLDSEIASIKKDHIEPIHTVQENLIFQCRITKWLAVVFFAGLLYSLADKIISLI